MRFIALLCVLSIAAGPVLADDAAIEARLKALEQEVAGLKKENDQLRHDLGLEVVARQPTVRTAAKSETLQIGGMLQAQTEAGDRGDTRFANGNTRTYLRRARLNAGGRFIEEFDFRLELELAGALANTTGLRAQLTDAYITWNRFDAASVRIGQFKSPFGFEQLYLDSRLSTIERSLVNDRLTPGRQIGVQVGGDVLDQRVSYAAGLFNGNGTNVNFNDNDKLMLAGRVSAVPFSGRLFDVPWRWSFGANGFRNSDAGAAVPPELGISSFTGHRSAVGYDTQLVAGRTEVWGEALRGDFEPSNGKPGPRLHASGWYAQAGYEAIRDKLQFIARREEFGGSGHSTRSSIVGLNWYLRHHDLKLQLDLVRSAVPDLAKQQQKVIARLQTVF